MPSNRNIDWSQIRPLRGSQHAAFEELCCQLARREFQSNVKIFTRKGTPDSGVECFGVHQDNTETAWQAKYFLTPPSAGQWAQVDDSVRQAIRGHPNLSRYIVCIPIDRSDARLQSQRSTLEKWESWCHSWDKLASKSGRSISFEFWGASELIDRLARPISSGIFSFWFGGDCIDAAWCERHVAERIENAGPRYTSKLTVSTPIAESFEWLLRKQGSVKRLTKVVADVLKSVRTMSRDFNIVSPGTESNQLWEICEALRELLSRQRDPVHVQTQERLAASCNAIALITERLKNTILENESTSGAPSARDWHDRYRGHPQRELLEDIDRCQASVGRLRRFTASRDIILSDSPFLLISGKAGSGKTHLLCDVAQQQIRGGVPTILLFGEQFSDNGDVWHQIIQMLGLRCHSRDELLDLLEVAAETSGERLLFSIDALNEGAGIKFWRRTLPGIMKAFAERPRIALAVSIREPYGDALFGEDRKEWPTWIDHNGFAEVLEQACAAFFAHYDIASPTVPTLQQEFHNPLFLTIFCKAINNSGVKALPEGIDGISLLLTFFIKSLREKLLGDHFVFDDPRGDRSAAVLAAIAIRMADRGVLTDEELHDAIASTKFITDVPKAIRILISEGVLRRITLYCSKSKRLCSRIGFGYERLLHHLLVRAVLVGSPNGDVTESQVDLDRVRTFYRANQNDDSRLEALQVELSETSQVELFQLIPEDEWTETAERAFYQSLASRSAKAVTQDAVKVFEAAAGASKIKFKEILPVIFDVCYRPRHPLNAEFLDHLLAPMKMVDRDEWWTVPLHGTGLEDSAVGSGRLVRWVLQSSSVKAISDESATLIAITLGWLLTSSDRFLRDRATKALVRLFVLHPSITITILQRFAGANDPYVVERILAACYGAALRSRVDSEVGSLAQKASQLLLSPPSFPHALIRHYARSLVEVAIDRHGLPTTARSRAPSGPAMEWIEPLSLAELSEHFEGDHPKLGKEAIMIINSVDHLGDFGHYAMECSQFTRVPRSDAEPPSTRREAIARIRQFVAELTPRQMVAVAQYVLELRNGLYESSSFHRIQEARQAASRSMRGCKRRQFDQMFASLWEHLERGGDEVQVATFPKETLQRFVLSWIAGSGWTSERFGEFDRSVNTYVRDAHKAERIGKKYQWLAYHEGLARIDDAFWMQPNKSRLGWEVKLREIDPALLLSGKEESSDDEVGQFAWWCTSAGATLCGDQTEHEWLRSSQGLPAPEDVVRIQDLGVKEAFLLLDGYQSIQERPAPGEDFGERPLRQIWWFTDCFVVPRSEWSKLKKWGVSQPADYFHRETTHEFYEPSIGEYPYGAIFRDQELYYNGVHKARSLGTPVGVLTCCDHYSVSDSGFDCSLDGRVEMSLPAPWLIHAMQMRHTELDGRWYGVDGRIACLDPSVDNGGKSALVVSGAAFINAIAARGETCYWLIRGEKNILGNDRGSWAGRMLYRFFCWIEDNQFRWHLATKIDGPR